MMREACQNSRPCWAGLHRTEVTSIEAFSDPERARICRENFIRRIAAGE